MKIQPNYFYFMLVFLTLSAFKESPKIINLNSNKSSLNNSCEQITFDQFMVYSDTGDSCILWGFISAKGSIKLEIEKYETDTKIYTWWTKGQFLLKTGIVEITNESAILNIPKERNARLHIQTVCGSAKIKLTDLRKGSALKN